MLPDLRLLLSYHDWANNRIFEGIVLLPENDWTRELGGSFPTVQATAAHLVGVEWIWVERWQGRNPTTVPAWMNAPSAAQLRAISTEVEAQRKLLVNSTGITQNITYRLFNGTKHTDTFGALLHHLVNHATYHRGQLAGMLRQLGKKPPSTDLLVYLHRKHKPI